MEETIWKKVRERIAGYADEVFRLQKELISIPALSPENGGEGEWRKAEAVRRLMDDIGYDELMEIHAPDSRVPGGLRPNLAYRWSGRSSDLTVWIMSHLDIVPPGDATQWEQDPFQAVLKDGKVIGRGSEDNHQAIVSSLLALKALRESGAVPGRNAGLVFVSDEETGSRYGIGHVLKTRPDLFRKEDLIVIPDAGDPAGTLIETAEKSILWVMFEVRGKQTHGSTPEKGINAHKAGAHLIVRMDGLHALYPKNDPLFDPPISTFEPTKKEANVPNINTIPGEDRFCFDCRILPDYGLEKIQKQIRAWADEIEKQFGVHVRIGYPQCVQAPPATASDAPVIKALQNSVRAVLGREARTLGIGGGTVAADFRERGLPAVCWTCLDDVAHAPNEYSTIENTLNDAAVFAHLFLQS
jgi:succinyl-diaminopimelate desuccinylase